MNAPKKVTVTVIADNHTHAGQPAAKGTQLTVDEATARWMIDNKVGLASGGAVDAGVHEMAVNEKKGAK